MIWEGDNHKIIYVFQINDFLKEKADVKVHDEVSTTVLIIKFKILVM